jgi:O-glycosyl hydrolase
MNRSAYAVLGILCLAVWATAATVTIDATQRYQAIDGFGGYGGIDAEWMGTPLYTDAWSQLIGQDLGLTIQRDFLADADIEPANDNSDSNSTDLTKYYTGGRYSLPMIGSLAAAGVPTFFFSHLSPPAWMKDNNSGVNGGALLPQYYGEFAEYCAAIVKLYKRDAGVDLYAMSIQNEPLFAEPYSSCVYTPQQMRDVVRSVGKRFAAEGIKTKIIIPEALPAQWAQLLSFISTICGDSVAGRYANIVAVHNYTADGVGAGSTGAAQWAAIASRAAQYGKHLWQTETSGCAYTWSGALGMASAIHVALKYGKVNAWCFYRLGLSADHNGEGSVTLGGNVTALGGVLKNYAKFVRPGAVQIGSVSSDTSIGVTSFVHDANRTLSLVVVNPGASKQVTVSGGSLPAQFKVYVSASGRICEDAGSVASSAAVTVPASSVVTLFGEGYTPPTEVSQPRSAIAPLLSAQTVAAGDAVMYGLDGRMVRPSLRRTNHGLRIVSVSNGGSRGAGVQAIYR